MSLFLTGVVVGALIVGGTLVVSEARRSIDPHCGDCAKLVTLCQCEGGPR